MAEKFNKLFSFWNKPSELKKMARFAQELNTDLSKLLRERGLDVPNVSKRWNLMAQTLIPFLDLIDYLELGEESGLSPEKLQECVSITWERIPEETRYLLKAMCMWRSIKKTPETLKDFRGFLEANPEDSEADRIRRKLVDKLYNAHEYQPPENPYTDES